MPRDNRPHPIAAPSLEDLHLDLVYSDFGHELSKKIILPAISRSTSYDRLSSYFNLSSLAAIGLGLDRLRRNTGTIRLIMGAHDPNPEVMKAVVESENSAVIAFLEQRILSGATSLENELTIDRIRAVAWMIKDGFLNIKIASLRNRRGLNGIFHNKRLIFRDAHGNVLAATGSANETGAGYGANFEELTLHKSWSEGASYIETYQAQFDEMWEGNHPNVLVTQLDTEFAEELLQRLSALDQTPVRSTQRTSESSSVGTDISTVIQASPLFAIHNSSEFPLYPHQERMLISVASRWPMRAIIADEVGLGKTYETASLIHFGIAHFGINRVVIAPPASLTLQWQQELFEAFGLDFWRYDSQNKVFIDNNGTQFPVKKGPFSGQYPNLTIVSRDLMRGTRKRGHAFANAKTLPDLIVVDEAHAARLRRDKSGKRLGQSLLRKMLEDILPEIPHALLVTATPLQTEASELYDLLHLLGLPEGFRLKEYFRSLDLLSTSPQEGVSITEASDALFLIEDSVSHYQLKLPSSGFLTKELQIGNQLQQDLSASFSNFSKASKNWPEVHRALVDYHPAAILSVRNTRRTLEEIGYTFPERHFVTLEVELPSEVQSILFSLNNYLNNELGRIERALYPDRGTILGFIKTIYHERMASSLASALDTLQNRLDKVITLETKGYWPGEEGTDTENGDEVELERKLRKLPLSQNVAFACNLERAELETLISRFSSLPAGEIAADPKMLTAMEQLAKHFAEDAQVLVFSKYTSTIRALVSLYEQTFGSSAPYAIFTGEGGVVKTSLRTDKGSKTLVTTALNNGTIPVVFCSEAASEGLNLQAARTLINIDIPWNPAKLEQRIGRIARLGQQSPEVTIVNIWYPNSVEARIYRRVLERKDIAEIALGDFPEIVGTAIRNAVLDQTFEDFDQRDIIEELQEARASTQLESLTRIWKWHADSGITGAEDMRQRLLGIIAQLVQQLGGTAKLVSDGYYFELASRSIFLTWKVDSIHGFTLRNEFINELLKQIPTHRLREHGKTFGYLAVSGKPLLFAIKQSSWIRVVRPDSLPEFLGAVLLGKIFDIDEHTYLEFRHGDTTTLVTDAVRGWWPDPTLIRTSPTHLSQIKIDWALPVMPDFISFSESQ